MPSITSLFFLTILCSDVILTLGTHEESDGLTSVCYGGSMRINNAIDVNFQENVRSLLSALAYESSSLHPPLSYAKTSVGRVSSRAYGSYLCRGDLSSKQCHNCLSSITRYMSSQYIDNSNCIGFGPSFRCIARYANTSEFSMYEEDLVFIHQSIGTNNVSNYQHYNDTLSNAMQGLIKEASYGDWTEVNFVTRVVNLRGAHQRIYILVQCATDISSIECSKCLGELYSHVPKCCSGSHGGIIVHANCLMKFDNSSFFGKGSRSFMPRNFHVVLLLLLTIYFTFT